MLTVLVVVVVDLNSALQYVSAIAGTLQARSYTHTRRNSREEHVGEPDTPDAARPRGESSDN